MNYYITGEPEKLIKNSDILIFLPATVQRIQIEKKVLKRDFLMDTVEKLLLQNPDYTEEEIAEKLLLDEELIKNIIARGKCEDGAQEEPTYTTNYLVYNQLTKTTYNSNPEERELLPLKCKEYDNGEVRFDYKSLYGLKAYAIRCGFETSCLSDDSGLKSNAIRAVKDAINENDTCETEVKNATPVSTEENCYILTGIRWHRLGKFISFDNWSVYSLVCDEDKRAFDTGLRHRLNEKTDPQLKDLRAAIKAKFDKMTESEKINVDDKKDLDAVCKSKNIRLSETLKARILERQRAINDKKIFEDTSFAHKLYSTMEWELFEVLKMLSKSRREKIRNEYKHTMNKPAFVARLFETAGLDYREKYFNNYFSTVNGGNITNILIKEQAEPTFGVLFICLLINNYIEADDGGYKPVKRLSEIFSGFIVEFSNTDFGITRNNEKHKGIIPENLGALKILCGNLDMALFGVDFIAELGEQYSSKVRVKITPDEFVLKYAGLKDNDDISAFKSILSNYASQDSQMYNDCERLLKSVMLSYIKRFGKPNYADRPERNGKIADALKKSGVVFDSEWGFLKSTVGNEQLLPQCFCDLLICDGRTDAPFLKALKNNYWIFGFIDDLINNKIGHTNAFFNLKEAGVVLEQVEEFTHIINNL